MSSKASPGGKKKSRDERILVIDDDPNVRMMVKVILKRSGFTDVEEFSSGDDVVRKLQAGRVDLVLLDWRMPGMPGIELLKTVRSWKDNVPIVMLTAQSGEDRVKEAIAAGVTDYIIKPFSHADLIEKVERALSRSATRKPD